MLHLWCSQESDQETFSHREDCKPSRRTARSKCAFTRGYNVRVGNAGRLFLDLIGVSRATKALQKNLRLVLIGRLHRHVQLRTKGEAVIRPSIQSDFIVSYIVSV